MKRFPLLPALLLVLIVSIVVVLLRLPADTPPPPTEESSAPSPKPAPPERPRYTMDIRVDTQRKSFFARIRLEFTNDSDEAWDTLYLCDINAGAVEHAHTAGEPSAQGQQTQLYEVVDLRDRREIAAARDEDDRSIVIVPLEQKLRPGRSIAIEYSYESMILRDDFFLSWMSMDDQHFLFEFGNFYPLLPLYREGVWQLPPYHYSVECAYQPIADYHVQITMPAAYTVASTGNLVDIREEGGSKTWTIEAVNSRDFSFSAANDFAKIENTVDGITVEAYYFTSQQQTGTRQEAAILLEHASAALRVYNDLLGAYPYDKLTVVPSYGKYGGLEYPGLVRISGGAQNFWKEEATAEQIAERHAGLASTTAHEVAHQWFYAIVGNDPYHDAWLDESLAVFLEQYWYRKPTTAPEELRARFEQDRTRIARFGGQIGAVLDIPAAEQEYYYYTVYVSGALFLYDLMQHLGEDVFRSFLQDYYQRYAFREAGTRDFLELLAEYAADNASVLELVQRHFRQVPEAFGSGNSQ